MCGIWNQADDDLWHYNGPNGADFYQDPYRRGLISVNTPEPLINVIKQLNTCIHESAKKSQVDPARSFRPWRLGRNAGFAQFDV